MNRSRLLLLIPLSLGLFGQEEVILDLRGTTPIKAPTRVEPPVQLRIKVQNVNDFLYSYRGSVKVDPLADTLTGDDSGTMGSLFAKGAGCATVDTAAKDFKAGLDKDFRLMAEDGIYPSIPLAESSAAWKKLEPVYRILRSATQQEQDCVSWKDYKKTDQPLAVTLAKAASGDHVYTFDASLQANGTVTVTVEEFYDEKPTKGGKRTFTFTTSSNQFFLSVGFVATQVQARAYDIVDIGVIKGTPAVPATADKPVIPATDDKTIRELRIQGEGRFRPASAVLLNYKLPWKPFLGSDKGVALSAGPVYRTSQSGGNTTATNFGIFAGASIHLWERLWLTPGFHLGEFSDIPQGLLRTNGSRVPDGFPSSFTGVNRWTTRFAIGLTFRATDFKAATALLARGAPASTGSGSAPGARGAAETAKPPAPAKLETAEAPPAGSIAASIVELKKSISAKEETLASANKTQSAAQTSFDAAVQASAVAQKEQKARAVAVAEKEKASKAASDAVKSATDALLLASAENRPAAQVTLTAVQGAAAKAAEELGNVKAQESVAAEVVKTKQAEATAAGERLSAATAATSKVIQDLDKLKAELKKVCAALGSSCPS